MYLGETRLEYLINTLVCPRHAFNISKLRATRNTESCERVLLLNIMVVVVVVLEVDVVVVVLMVVVVVVSTWWCVVMRSSVR